MAVVSLEPRDIRFLVGIIRRRPGTPIPLPASKRHLEKALIALLFFSAAKLALQATEHVVDWHVLHISPNVSLLVVLGTLGAGIVASFIWPGEREPADPQHPQEGDGKDARAEETP